MIDELARAICGLLKAQAEYDKGYGAYDGHSWVWAGAEVSEKLDNAKRRLKEALDDYIDERIAKARGQAPS